MSFSFSAGGTLEETKSSLATELSTEDGERTRQLVLSFLEDAPAASAHDGTLLRYSVSAYGHHGGAGSEPSLSVSLSCTRETAGVGG